MNDTLEKISSIHSVSGNEEHGHELIKNMLTPFCEEVFVDCSKNITGVKKSDNQNAIKVMLEAHLDEIGLMVKDIHDGGFVSFVCVGGVDKRILPATEVYIYGKEVIFGVIGAKPPHLLKKEDQDKLFDIKDMYIDTGFSREYLEKHISIGDMIAFKAELEELCDGRVVGRCLDDRAGVYAVIECAKRLSKEKLKCDCMFSITACEEIHSNNVQTAIKRFAPDICISIDVCHGVTYDNKKNAFPLGSGVALSEGPNVHRRVLDKLKNCAKNNNIPYLIEVSGGSTGTNAWQVQITGMGVATAVASIPLRYMHTNTEVADMSDIENTIMLLCEYIKSIDLNKEDLLCIY